MRRAPPGDYIPNRQRVQAVRRFGTILLYSILYSKVVQKALNHQGLSLSVTLTEQYISNSFAGHLFPVTCLSESDEVWNIV